ncbi:ATP-dependent DNA helicase DinG [Pontibacillus litoralis]|uniref:3'-5' exonuclease DinG n=1 Tax=Pontibacillus litoralis JSM 072002 TaxID=1385512 RepID=A0A0A5G7A1_9BACI|nr:ATP-dependent DNA helicase DinG [Pontibacillus litoralis]KGX87939.1 DnaQ family exonuclease/DinG family helicase [Pontibacillus litoralis JSM 072002]
MDKFVVVDLETTGHAPKKGDKIIEVGIVLIQGGQIVDQFKSFVNPEQPIPAFITQLTSITDDDVKGAPLFTEIADTIISMCEGAYFVAHHAEFDLGFLNHAVQDARGFTLQMPVIDTVELARIFMPQAPGYKLSQLSDYLHMKHSNPHRALSDATVTGEIFIQLLHKGKQLPYETIDQLMRLQGKLKSDMGDIFQSWLNEKAFAIEERSDLEIVRGLALKRVEDDAEVNEDSMELSTEGFAPFLEEVLRPGGQLEQTLHTFEERPGQREMATTIYDAYQSQQHGLVEAETGTGKSLAYLLPSIYEAITTKSSVMISTYTTQLQTQLLDKEIPMLQQALPCSFRSALLKGKQHYLSLQKFEYELFSTYLDNYDIVLTKCMILVWLTETTTGDVDEIQLPSSGAIFWRKISAEAEGYPNPKSPWFMKSFYQRAKKQAEKAHIVITNHSLLCTDIIHQYGLVQSYPKVIIDEAHHLEKVAAKHFGLKLDYVSLQYLLNGMGGNNPGEWMHSLLTANTHIALKVSIRKWDGCIQSIKEEADDLFRYLFTYVSKQRDANISFNDVGRYQYRYEPAKESSRVWSTVKEMAGRLTFQLKDAITMLEQCKQGIHTQEDSEETSKWLEDIQMYVDRIRDTIDAMYYLLVDEGEPLVKWIELEAQGAKNAVFLYSEPIEVGPLLKEAFFEHKESVVLTSATLTMNESFAFMLERLGLSKEETIQRKIASPFNYNEQVQLLVPNDFPSIKGHNQEDFIHATCEAIYSLATLTKGRMLVLFTSYEMLKKTYYVMKEFMDIDEFMLIAQGVSSGSRTRLIKNFQAFDHAILFGTSSFWEGVDIPGDDLTSLVIVRLPFQPPNHPVYQAKAEKIKGQEKNPFMALSLPNAVIRFKQGFGRLIRSSTDRGLVFVCDDRLMKAKYGKYFIQSIPKVPVHYASTHDILQKAEQWL